MGDTSAWYLKNYKDTLTKQGRVLPKVELSLVKKSVERNSHRDTQHLHPSEISKRYWCHRASVYQITDVPKSAESFSFHRLNIFEEGHEIHSKWQHWLWDAGLLCGRFRCISCGYSWYSQAPDTCQQCGKGKHFLQYREVPLRDDEHRLIGHADGEINDERGKALIEVKSIGIGTVRFEKPSLYDDYSNKRISIDDVWKNIKAPFPSHIRQGQIYMHCRKIDSIVFIYEWKPSQQVKEFEVKAMPEMVQPILDGCKTVMQHLDSGTIPNRPEWATSRSCAGCKMCPYKEVCYANDPKGTARPSQGQVQPA